jgi:hypothetical protein
MIDWTGPIPSAAVSRTAALVLAAPIAGALADAALGARMTARARAIVAAAIAALGAAVAVALAWASSGAAGGTWIAPLATIARFGQLDVNATVVVDSDAAFECAAVSLACAIAFAVCARRRFAAPPQLYAIAHVAALGATIAIVADDLPFVIFGWTVASLATAAMARAPSRYAVAIAGASSALVLLGASTLYWGMAGGWSRGAYTPALGARVAIVRAPGSAASAPPPRRLDFDGDDDDEEWAPADRSAGFVTMTTYPGAELLVDDARTPLARAPFTRVALPGGKHKLRIRAGSGADDSLIAQVAIAGGQDVEIVTTGASLSLREIALQLELRDGKRDRPMLAALVARAGWWGALAVVTLAPLLLGLGAIVRATEPVARRIAPAPLAAIAIAASVVPAVALVMRCGPLLEQSPRARTLLLVASAIAVIAAARAWRRRSPAPEPERSTRGAIDLAAALALELDEWVVRSVVAAAGAAVRAAAWIAAKLDDGVVDAPPRAAAVQVERAAISPAAVWSARALGVAAVALVAAALVAVVYCAARS